MRLSLAIAIALLFGSVHVLANPAPMNPSDQPPPPDNGGGKGKEREKSNTPPEQGGSHGSSDSTDAGFGFTRENRGWASVPVRHFVSVFFLPIRAVLKVMSIASRLP